jgi:Sec-independent protein translocase protein TatA
MAGKYEPNGTGIKVPGISPSPDKPRAGVEAGHAVRAMRSMLKQVLQAVKTPTAQDQSDNQTARAQAYQARQLGKLSSAITDLTDKDWNVNVKFRSNSAISYYKHLNRLM